MNIAVIGDAIINLDTVHFTHWLLDADSKERVALKCHFLNGETLLFQGEHATKLAAYLETHAQIEI